MNNLSLLTYTHTNAKDLHEAYFKRLKKYFPLLTNNYVTCNEHIDYTNCIIYDDSTTHGIQMINALNQIPTDYVIYSQEDYILFDYVNTTEIEKLINYMDYYTDIPFIRLIHSGLGNDIRHYNEDLGYLDQNSEYYFSTQITLWRKNILYKMYETANPQKITSTEVNHVQFLRNISKNGLFHLKRGKQVGNHFNSYAYPYIATAVVKGLWNYSEYKNELNDLFEEFNIMPYERGVI